MQTPLVVPAIFVKTTKRFHRYDIDETGKSGIIGQIYLPVAIQPQAPRQIDVQVDFK